MDEDQFDQDFETVYSAFESAIATMEDQGLDPHSINAALLALFSERMFQMGEREMYESILQDAIEDEWPDRTVH